MSLYVGLISGTSMDGIDAALLEIKQDSIQIIDFHTFGYSENLVTQLNLAILPDYQCSLHEIATLDSQVGIEFARAANALLEKNKLNPKDISAIGSHGQTLRHSPDTSPPYTLQIGSGAVICSRTKITTVCDFRSQDVAAGGEGAPLVPPFHEAVFRTQDLDRFVLNVGGIANISVLPKDPKQPIQGFDTGPGNCLMDVWCQKHLGRAYDNNGEWAASGRPIPELLDELLKDSYIQKPAPKSTGREYFNLDYIEKVLKTLPVSNTKPEDVQATLLNFTVRSIALGINQSEITPSEIILCGGGARNLSLLKALRDQFSEYKISEMNRYGVDGDAIEAAAFAWLAHRQVQGIATELPASRSKCAFVLGARYSSQS